jgi:hypothetical protein
MGTAANPMGTAVIPMGKAANPMGTAAIPMGKTISPVAFRRHRTGSNRSNTLPISHIPREPRKPPRPQSRPNLDDRSPKHLQQGISPQGSPTELLRQPSAPLLDFAQTRAHPARMPARPPSAHASPGLLLAIGHRVPDHPQSHPGHS